MNVLSIKHECAHWLSHSLNDLRQHPTNNLNTLQFPTKLSEHINITNQTMVSFDVKSLFKNNPTTYTTNLILDSIFNNKHLLHKLEWLNPLHSKCSPAMKNSFM